MLTEVLLQLDTPDPESIPMFPCPISQCPQVRIPHSPLSSLHSTSGSSQSQSHPAPIPVQIPLLVSLPVVVPYSLSCSWYLINGAAAGPVPHPIIPVPCCLSASHIAGAGAVSVLPVSFLSPVPYLQSCSRSLSNIPSPHSRSLSPFPVPAPSHRTPPPSLRHPPALT